MKFVISLCLMVFCALSLAQDEGNATDTRSCHPDLCELLTQFGVMSEKLRTMEIKQAETETSLEETKTSLEETETRLANSETRLEETEIKLADTESRLKVTENRTLELQNKGVFTAPVAGVYYFTLFYHAGGERSSWLNLYKNGQVMVVTSDHLTSSDGADNGGNAVFLQLNKGDQVYVRMAKNTHIWASSVHTTFSGYLVTQM